MNRQARLSPSKLQNFQALKPSGTDFCVDRLDAEALSPLVRFGTTRLYTADWC